MRKKKQSFQDYFVDAVPDLAAQQKDEKDETEEIIKCELHCFLLFFFLDVY